ncbi:hypothetical protein VN97_g3326 [Penicillium thymicola]|uniref:Uncharacterized protein n=1 Tax=Penicillium thymicola TaxID=293382 RepID=A0AAI9TMV7_PENTH|nr:hypothetical protein VN97_g3326 [Penicillium thymicola]
MWRKQEKDDRIYPIKIHLPLKLAAKRSANSIHVQFTFNSRFNSLLQIHFRFNSRFNSLLQIHFRFTSDSIQIQYST